VATINELEHLRHELGKALERVAEVEGERNHYRERAFKAELEGGWRVEPSWYAPREVYERLRNAMECVATFIHRDPKRNACWLSGEAAIVTIVERTLQECPPDPWKTTKRPDPAAKYPPANHGNITHTWVTYCGACAAAGVRPVVPE
jgi:hypothetical protein